MNSDFIIAHKLVNNHSSLLTINEVVSALKILKV